MELRVLRYFIEVAREQNITAAADRLHISQPALSKQLMELEQELGKILITEGNAKRHLQTTECFYTAERRKLSTLPTKRKTRSKRRTR